MDSQAYGNETLRVIRELYCYNSRTRKKYLRAIFSKVPKKERYTDKGASFPSVVDIFIHVIDAYRYWFLFADRGKVEEFQRLRGTERFSQRRAEEEEARIDSFMSRFLGRLKPADLKRMVKAGKRSLTMRDLLIHMAEEELQHRGELNALFWQMGVEPPHTEYGA